MQALVVSLEQLTFICQNRDRAKREYSLLNDSAEQPQMHVEINGRPYADCDGHSTKLRCFTESINAVDFQPGTYKLLEYAVAYI